jgi:hypothetical protein
MPNEVEIRITSTDLSGPAFMSVLANMAKLRAAAKALSGEISLTPSISGMNTYLNLLKSKIQSMGIADIADVNVPQGRITTQLHLLKRLIGQAGISDMLDFNVSASGLSDQLGKIANLTETIPVNFAVNKGELNRIFAVGGGGETIPISFSGLTGGVGQIAALNLAFAGMDREALAAGAAVTSLIGSGSSGGAGGGSGVLGLAAASAWFGRVFKTNFAGWGSVIGNVALWHVVLDGAIEAAIIAVSSFAALAAAADALGGTALNLGTNLESIYKVNTALGSTVPPLTDRFVALQKALAPQGIEIYGNALNAISLQSGSMAKAMVPVVNLFDNFAAKFVLWEKGFGSTGAIFAAGIGFLRQMGSILSTVGVGIGNLVKADPGIARFLLDLIQGTATAFLWLTKLPAPLLEFALALHGAYVWGSVLAGLMGKLIGLFGNMYKSLAAYATNPFAWAVVAAATLVYLGYEAQQADDHTKKFLADMNAGLAQLSGFNAFGQTIIDITQLSAAIKGVNWQSIANGMDLFQQVKLNIGFAADSLSAGITNLAHIWSRTDIVAGLKQVGDALGTVLLGTNGAFGQQAQNDINAYNNEVNKLLGDQKNMLQVMGHLTQDGFSVAQSWALMSLAGVKASDTFQVALQKVNGLIMGYRNLGMVGGILQNSINAVTFASLQQQSQVAALNTAFDTFFTTVSGGESAFASFGTDLATLKTDGVAAGASLTGLNANSLTLRSQFITTAAGANTLMDNLTLLTSASGLGTKGTAMLTQATKDLLATQLPLAANTPGLTAVLYALAQRGGYTGADSFKALTQWVGKVQNPMKQLDGIVGQLSVDAGNLTQDVKNLSDALGVTLNNAMSTAIFDASGGQKVFDQFATSVLNAHGNIDQMVPSAKKIADELLTVTGSTKTAHAEFDTFAQGLGLTRQQADVLWGRLGNLQNFINGMHGKTLSILAADYATAAIRRVAGELAALNGYNVNTYINVITRGTIGGPVVPGGRAGGGVIGAAAGGGIRSGWTLVGEQGRELVQLGAGSTVHSNPDTERMLGGAGMGPIKIVVSYDGSAKRGLDADTLKRLRYTVVTVGGGDVQQAFGRNGA